MKSSYKVVEAESRDIPGLLSALKTILLAVNSETVTYLETLLYEAAPRTPIWIAIQHPLEGEES